MVRKRAAVQIRWAAPKLRTLSCAEFYFLFGNQCDNTANEILSAGDNGYWVYAWPDISYETFKKDKVHWRNQNGINRGVDI